MFFGRKTYTRPEKGMPRSLRRQIMLQFIFLVMVVGLLIVLLRQLHQGDEDLRSHVVHPPRPSATPEGRVPPEGAGVPVEDVEDVEDLELGVEVVEPGEPEPFVERPEVFLQARVLEAKGEVDLDAVVYLLQKLRTRREDDPADPVLSAVRGDAVWERIMEKPDHYRGSLVEIRGNLVARSKKLSPFRLDTEHLLETPNPAGVPALYRAFLYDGARFFAILTWRNPGDLEHMDPVVVRGYFSQLFSYDVTFRGRQQKARIPLVVAEDFEPLPPVLDRGVSLRPLYYLVLALPVVALLFIAVLSWPRGRRPRPSFRRRRPPGPLAGGGPREEPPAAGLSS